MVPYFYAFFFVKLSTQFEAYFWWIDFLNIEYIYRRLKAKRALFKGRSLSLASFTLPLPKFLPLVRQRSSKSPGKVRYRKTEQSDEKYLEENRPQGELEILALESLIDLNDVKKDANKIN